MAWAQNAMLRDVSVTETPHARLEPLAIGVDQRDERHRRAADLRREQREVVERLLGLRIQNAVPRERRESGRLVTRHDVPCVP